MSAFLCSDNHLSVLAIAIDKENAQYTFKQLKLLNIQSVNYRYKENMDIVLAEKGFTEFSLENYNNYQLIKVAACYCYQSCEIPDHKSHKTWVLVENFRNNLSTTTIMEHPNYKAAAWEIE